jgi:ferric-dicitrate binding protein FerR (iron transport regulator)
MSEHAPKLAAIEALVEGRLSARARARLETHLASCETCRRARDAVREYAAMRDAARALPVPELSFEALERKIEANPTPRRTQGKWIAIALPVLALVATVVIGWVGISGQREAQELAARSAPRTQPVRDAAQSEAVSAPRTGQVTLAMGEASLGEVREGMRLETGPREELHVRLGAGSGILLWPDSALEVTRLRGAEVLLTLQKGRVSNEVSPLAQGSRYAVAAAAYRAEVRGTAFEVGLSSEIVDVAVHEGRVAVLRDGATITILGPGERFQSQGDAPAPRDARRVIGLSREGETAVVELPQLSIVEALWVEGTRLPASADIAMRWPPGVLSLEIEDAAGRRYPMTLEVATEGTRIEEAAIRKLMREADEARLGTLDPALISPVIRAAIPTLKRCYERALKIAPQLEGTLTLSIRVAPDGHVARAQVSGPTELPEALESCIVREVRGLTFPRPDGGPVQLELPLKLAATQAH